MRCDECGSIMQEVDYGIYECHNPNCSEYLIGKDVE